MWPGSGDRHGNVTEGAAYAAEHPWPANDGGNPHTRLSYFALLCLAKYIADSTPLITSGRGTKMDVHRGQTMPENPENGREQRGSRWRIAAWTAAGLVLLLPFIAMQFTDEVAWDVADFAIFGALLVGAGVAFELAARKSGNTAYKTGVGVALAAAFLLIWVNGAVGIIGNEGNDANLMFYGVLGVGLIGALIARFEPQGMARAMIATAGAQVLVFVIALVAGWGFIGLITFFFLALWVGSARLFQNAARGGPERGAI